MNPRTSSRIAEHINRGNHAPHRSTEEICGEKMMHEETYLLVIELIIK